MCSEVWWWSLIRMRDDALQKDCGNRGMSIPMIKKKKPVYHRQFVFPTHVHHFPPPPYKSIAFYIRMSMCHLSCENDGCKVRWLSLTRTRLLPHGYAPCVTWESVCLCVSCVARCGNNHFEQCVMSPSSCKKKSLWSLMRMCHMRMITYENVSCR